MAKGKPTVSKGIFNPGLNKGKAEGPSSKVGGTATVNFPGKTADSVIRKEQASNVYSKQKAQKPLG